MIQDPVHLHIFSFNKTYIELCADLSFSVYFRLNEHSFKESGSAIFIFAFFLRRVQHKGNNLLLFSLRARPLSHGFVTQVGEQKATKVAPDIVMTSLKVTIHCQLF